jgi:hypothetical protein
VVAHSGHRPLLDDTRSHACRETLHMKCLTEKRAKKLKIFTCNCYA